MDKDKNLLQEISKNNLVFMEIIIIVWETTITTVGVIIIIWETITINLEEIKNNNSFGGSYNNYGGSNNSNNKGSGITSTTNSLKNSLMKNTLPWKKWMILFHQIKLIIMMDRKVSQLTEIIMVAITMIIGETVLIIMEEITIL